MKRVCLPILCRSVASRFARCRHYCITRKTVTQSMLEQSIPLSSDAGLRERYAASIPNGVRVGRILEFLDGFAGSVAYRFCEDNSSRVLNPRDLSVTSTNRDLTIVTAAFDNVELYQPLLLKNDLLFKGHVSYAGKTSLEVEMSVFAEDPTTSKSSIALSAKAVFVARHRNPEGKVPYQVPELLAADSTEREIMDRGQLSNENRAAKRREASQQHSAVDVRQFPDYTQGGYTRMSDTKKQSILWMHPQDRNIHGKIYGGYLIRQSYELGYVTAATFSNRYPVFLQTDDMFFLHPVSIGSVLQLNSIVGYTSSEREKTGAQRDIVQVRVDAEVVDIMNQSTVTTNVFNFSFLCAGNEKVVAPVSICEGRMYLESKLKAEASKRVLSKTLYPK